MFDVVIMNPPYGKPEVKMYYYIHYQITNAVKKKAKHTLSVIPLSLLTLSKMFNKFILDMNTDLQEIDTVDGSLFTDADISSVGIFEFKKDRQLPMRINFRGNCQEVNDIYDFKNVNNAYENELLEILKYNGGIQDRIIDPRNFKNRYNYYIFTNRSNGSKNATFQSANLSKFLPSDYETAYHWHTQVNTKYKYIIGGDSKLWLENLSKAMKRPLLRFGLYRSQILRNMTINCYRHIPNIDWENPQCLTDVGILEMCGVSTEKATEYVEYATKVISKI